MSLLSSEFLSAYKDKKTPWGFNGLGYIVYKRTYSRPKPDGSLEEWPETIARAIEGIQSIGGGYTPEEAEQLFDHMFNLRCSLSGRALWQAGTPLGLQYGDSYCNCWSVAIRKPEDFLFVFHELLLGGGVGFSVMRSDINELPRIRRNVRVEHERTNDADFIVPDSRQGWVALLARLFQAYFVTGDSFTYSTILVRGRGEPIKGFGGTACLTGDTLLYKGTTKEASKDRITVKDFYEKFNKRVLRKFYIRSLDEETGIFYRNEVLGVVSNGVQPVYRITTKNGYTIKATDNHRFMDADRRYKEVSSFNAGELIAVNGHKIYNCVSCETGKTSRRNSKCHVCRETRSTKCADCSKYISRKGIRCKSCVDAAQTTKGQTRKHHDVSMLSARKAFCQLCGNRGVPFEVHHLDHDSQNNNWKNLLNLCLPCHKSIHAIENRFGDAHNHTYLSFDEIVSIEYAGEEEVYDLQMAAPDHNFVANGFVSHNSGPLPLIEGVQQIAEILASREGKKLRSTDVLDVCNVIGSIVVSGNVRRSSQIAVGDADDVLFLRAKRWDLGNIPNWRAFSNNTINADSFDYLSDDFWQGYAGNGEPYGLFNQRLAQSQGRLGEYIADRCELPNPLSIAA